MNPADKEHQERMEEAKKMKEEVITKVRKRKQRIEEGTASDEDKTIMERSRELIQSLHQKPANGVA